MYKQVSVIITFAALLMSSTAFAADAVKGDLPAVSGPNGKVELSGGWAGINGFDSLAVFQGGASISVPLGERFGLQFDVADVNKFSDNMIGGNLHLFTRTLIVICLEPSAALPMRTMQTSAILGRKPSFI